MKKVKIVDYFSIYTFHEIINYSLLVICNELFNGVTYVSGKTAQNNMKRLMTDMGYISEDTLSYKTVPVYNKDTPVGAVIRDVCGFFITIYQYIVTPYHTLLIYNYTNKLSLPFILLLNIILRKRIIFLFHGDLEYLISRVSYVKTTGWYKKCMQLSFCFLFGKSPAYIFVLGESIKNNLIKLYPHLQPYILSIYHPCFYEDNRLNKSQSLNSKAIRIVMVGAISANKGLMEYISLASSLKDLLSQQKLELYCIGKVNSKNIELPDTIVWKTQSGGLPREEFDAQIQELDYLLYLYPVDSYKLTASGAVLDAVKWHKPIIALHNEYFDFFMKDAPIGYLAYSMAELEQIIRQIVAGNLHSDFSKNFSIIEDRTNIVNTTIAFKEELSKVQLL